MFFPCTFIFAFTCDLFSTGKKVKKMRLWHSIADNAFVSFYISSTLRGVLSLSLIYYIPNPLNPLQIKEECTPGHETISIKQCFTVPPLTWKKTFLNDEFSMYLPSWHHFFFKLLLLRVSWFDQHRWLKCLFSKKRVWNSFLHLLFWYGSFCFQIWEKCCPYFVHENINDAAIRRD